ncbi:homoserine dehydrogenase [Peribacillus glennii]|uniref:Homoserine dehydrogenase n=1 Tax=Peribacillus glennii TaxID=2303991 RepID=A0A372LA18_9BACI|nr:homoserine dehydrogenase [Peribacillus glennii]RFU62069.1 homoserine dehydrogenase [Peribacillus glennii]
MTSLKVALLGLGTVGLGVFESITQRKEQIEGLIGRKIEISGVLIKNQVKSRDLHDGVFISKDFEEVITRKKPEVVIEAIGGIEPARTYIEYSLRNGCHVVSANKDCIARHGKELQKIARENGVRFVYEASVAGGIPVLRTLRELLAVNKVERLEAILNGTSNFILSMMRSEGASFTEALALAQQKGFAEQDPTNDIEGIDAFYKSMILSEWIYGDQPDWANVQVKGISGITLDEIRAAEKIGLRVKHLVSIDESLKVEITPKFVDSEHPLYSVENVNNAVLIKTDLLGDLTLIGAGAGAKPTASAIVEDLISLYLTLENLHFNIPKRADNSLGEEGAAENQEQTMLLFYENLSVQESAAIISDLEERGSVITYSEDESLGLSYVLFIGRNTDYSHPKLKNVYDAIVNNVISNAKQPIGV